MHCWTCKNTFCSLKICHHYPWHNFLGFFSANAICVLGVFVQLILLNYVLVKHVSINMCYAHHLQHLLKFTLTQILSYETTFKKGTQSSLKRIAQGNDIYAFQNWMCQLRPGFFVLFCFNITRISRGSLSGWLLPFLFRQPCFFSRGKKKLLSVSDANFWRR